VALSSLATVWCLLLLGAACAPFVGPERARLGAYAACAALLAWTRPRAPERASPAGALLAGAAGFVALPAWLAAIFLLGSALGLPHARSAPGALTLSGALANLALAPLFEELLYRERLLPALRARLGAPLALVASSALFALPHLEAWSVLGAFLVGLALGGVLLVSGRVELCVGYHAGLNAALAVSARAPAPAPWAGLAGLLLLALACAWTRRLRASPGVHAAARGADAPRPRRARGLHEPAACPRSRSGC
jgi:membrane protease YdiL (CAAX protease family)